jgi:outer membrane immunogenic protein
MKSTIIASFLVAAGCASASAADLAAVPTTKAHAVVDPAYDWTGFYVGAHLGAGWDRGSMIGDPVPDPANYGFGQSVIPLGSSSNVVAGGQVGFNWQFAPNFLLGLEADLTGTALDRNGRAAPVPSPNPFRARDSFAQASQHIDWLGSVRGRGGFIGERLLLYATGGIAWKHASYTANEVLPNLGDAGGFSNPGSSNATKAGWVVGGGVEYAWTGNWIGRAEYLHYHFEDSFFGPIVPGRPGFVIGIRYGAKTDLDVVRAGVSYKFGGPIVARY